MLLGYGIGGERGRGSLFKQGRGDEIFPSTKDLQQMGKLAMVCNTSEQGERRREAEACPPW